MAVAARGCHAVFRANRAGGVAFLSAACKLLPSMSLPHAANLLSATIRHGHPDFIDLPWGASLQDWRELTERFANVPRGASRHPVTFVTYEERIYALKELPLGIAESEYDLLREMLGRRLPVVEPVGHARVRMPAGERSVLITRYLDHSIPYETLVQGTGLARYRQHLLDAMAGLLVQLHLAGVFWGDCSLANTLFRRDAGRLNAYLVDAETSTLHGAVDDGLRQTDLDIMFENVAGGLADLHAIGALPADFDDRIGERIGEKYAQLWGQITREEAIGIDERYRIEQRIRAINDLGFSVEQIELIPAETGDRLRLRAQVTDRHYHSDLLHNLTGVDAEEMQARQMLNEIQELKLTLSTRHNHSMPLSAAAHHWLNEFFLPATRRLAPNGGDPAESYCQLLEHKWYMSERVKHDVGHDAAIDDYLQRFG